MPNWVKTTLQPEFGGLKVLTAAGVAKLADAPGLGSGVFGRGGSSPATRTILFLEGKKPSNILKGNDVFGVLYPEFRS